MAKLSAHGTEVGTIYLATSAKRYMSDGKILKNTGFGWKLYATLKAGVVPSEAFARAEAKQREMLAQRPAFAAYRKELHALAGLSKRWKLQSAIQGLGNDYDGVWSEACDGYGDNVHADLDEVVHLCQLYETATKESETLKIMEPA